MKIQKTIAVIMLLTSSLLTGLVSRDIAYPAILCMLGLLGLQRRFTWDFKPERRVITSLLLLLLAVMFSFHYHYVGFTGRLAYVQAAAVAWQTIARYFLASMVLVLFLGSPQRLPFSLGLFHIAVTISAGQVLLLDDINIAYRLSELLSVVLVVIFAASACGSTDRPIPKPMWRMSRWYVFALILVVTANCGWIMSSILYRYVEVFSLPVWVWRGGAALDGAAHGVSRVGFSRSGELSSLLLIKGDQDPTPMLSITCDGSPGYLRARAFEVYRQSKWQNLSHQEALFPEQNIPFGVHFVGRRNIFRLNSTDSSQCKYMTIRHESRFADAVFTPLGTSFLEAPFNLLLRDKHDIVYTPNLRSGLNYRIGYTKSAYRKPPNGMLNIPSHLDQRVYQLANRIFAGCTTTTDKIAAVVNHFRTNYTYSLGLDIPPDRDKLVHFLLEESTGYCEYFASGAAILLRLAGVPTRYVTGFLVTEKDARNEYWLARNMDAHAWAEAWDQEKNQWTIVEATVGEDLAEESAAEQLAGLGGDPGTLLGKLLQAVYQYGLFGVLGWFFISYGPLAGLAVLIVLLGVVLSLVLFRHYYGLKSKSETQSRAFKNPGLVILHRMLTRMDRKVKAAGPLRHHSETLHAFSQRLRAQSPGDRPWTDISDWYLEYANLRYCRTISSKRLQELQQLAQRLQNSL